MTEVVAKQRLHSHYRIQNFVGKVHKILIEGYSKRSDQDFAGRNDQNAMVVFPVDNRYKIGDYVNVIGESCTSATLLGRIVE